jgi:hypothetical protein
MNFLRATALLLLATPVFAAPGNAAELDVESMTFAVMRDGGIGTNGRIGTYTVNVARDGAETTVKTETHVAVKVLGVVVHRMDQSIAEHWAEGRLSDLIAVTDDNGATHRTDVIKQGNRLRIESNGQSLGDAVATAVPFNYWNVALTAGGAAFDPEDGTARTIAVTDRGRDDIMVLGRMTHTHDFRLVEAGHAPAIWHDVWFDENNRLVQTEERGSDGSRITYQRS